MAGLARPFAVTLAAATGVLLVVAILLWARSGFKRHLEAFVERRYRAPEPVLPRSSDNVAANGPSSAPLDLDEAAIRRIAASVIAHPAPVAVLGTPPLAVPDLDVASRTGLEPASLEEEPTPDHA